MLHFLPLKAYKRYLSVFDKEFSLSHLTRALGVGGCHLLSITSNFRPKNDINLKLSASFSLNDSHTFPEKIIEIDSIFLRK